MNMPRREIKWAAVGFAGGFLLCYLLVGAFQSHRPASSLLARVTSASAWPAVPVLLGPQFTNVALPELRIESPPRWRGPAMAPGAPYRPHRGYSLDLIDTHVETPKLPENQ
jgi:hypothetical protein